MLKQLYLDSPAHADKADRTRIEDERKIKRVIRFWGPQRDVRTLSESDVRRFVRARREGDESLVGIQLRSRVRDRTIEADLVAVRTMLNWGVVERDRHGNRLLTENPLKGVSFPREKNPRQPLISHEEFLALLAVADEVTPLLRLALLLAEGTGRRLSAIRQLRWSDINLKDASILWREENDKIGMEGIVPISEDVRQALQEARSTRPAIGDAWVFPSPKKADKPVGERAMKRWLQRAYQLAGRDPKPWGGWHMLRRKWVTERKDHPLVDIAAAGGWKDPRTPQLIYQKADRETIRNVVLNPTHRLTSM